jgi:hypothetical protein
MKPMLEEYEDPDDNLISTAIANKARHAGIVFRRWEDTDASRAWFGRPSLVSHFNPERAEKLRRFAHRLGKARVPWGVTIRCHAVNLQDFAANTLEYRQAIPLTDDQALSTLASEIAWCRAEYGPYCKQFFFDSPVTGVAGNRVVRMLKERFPTCLFICESGGGLFDWGEEQLCGLKRIDYRIYAGPPVGPLAFWFGDSRGMTRKEALQLNAHRPLIHLSDLDWWEGLLRKPAQGDNAGKFDPASMG